MTAAGLLLAGILGWLPSRHALAASDLLYVAPDGVCGGMVPCYTSPQEAVDNANPGATVKVATGTYTSAGAEVLSISQAITLTGGFSGSNWNLAAPSRYPVVLDAENVAGRRALTVQAGETDEVIISGIEFRRGYSPDNPGGGVFIDGGLVRLSDSRLQENTATYGGGLYLAAGQLELSTSVVESNLALWDGGGLAVESGTLALTENQITGNSALRHGGGLVVIDGQVAQEANRYRLNSADAGAAVALAGGDLHGVNDLVADNLSPWEAVYVGGGTLTALHWTVADNGDFGVTSFGGTVVLTNSVVVSHTESGVWGSLVYAFNGLYNGNGVDCGGGASCSASVYGSPNFVNAGGGNYHLQEASPARDAAADAGVTTDFDGDVRPVGEWYDIGADEWTEPLQVYLPLVKYERPPDPGELPEDMPLPVAMTGTAPFESLRSGLNAQGKDLSYVKIGFHVGSGGNQNGLGDWMRALDTAGVPFFLKSADSAGQIYEAARLKASSGVPHILVYRKSTNSTYDYDTPNYSLSPQAAAQAHWNEHMDVFPTELLPYRSDIWIETINEVDKDRSDWLGEFAYETAQITLANGYNWAAFGWSTGEPEREHWETPGMLKFLRLAGNNPDRLAVAVHEYSLTTGSIGYWYPYLVGRFQALFDVCDEHGIPRPTVLITEWGWEYQNIPSVSSAMEDIAWASWFYSAYPEVKGAAIWYLGPNFGNIDDQTQKLIAPLTEYALTHYFTIWQGQWVIDPTPFTPATRGPIPDVELPVPLDELLR